MNEGLHPHVAALMKKYGRDLSLVTPSPSLDARIDQLVAAPPAIAHARPVRRWQRPLAWAAAASFAVLAISAGIIIGVKLERSRDLAAATALAREAVQQVAWAPPDLTMWPSDSVELTIPAEYSAQGTLVAVNPQAESTGKRFWIDVVVSNDGTFRIERIVPAESDSPQAEKNGITPHIQ
jgi:hypothetical protein